MKKVILVNSPQRSEFEALVNAAISSCDIEGSGEKLVDIKFSTDFACGSDGDIHSWFNALIIIEN